MLGFDIKKTKSVKTLKSGLLLFTEFQHSPKLLVNAISIIGTENLSSDLIYSCGYLMKAVGCLRNQKTVSYLAAVCGL